jgi:hypothetical protein
MNSFCYDFYYTWEIENSENAFDILSDLIIKWNTTKYFVKMNKKDKKENEGDRLILFLKKKIFLIILF